MVVRDDPDLTLADCSALLRAEYFENPDLIMTSGDVQSLLGLDADTSEAILRDLVDSGFLQEVEPGVYARAVWTV